MANVFDIKITATDNATKVVNKVNKSVAKIFAPYDKAKQSAGTFFKALNKNDLISRPTSALNKLGGAIGGLGDSFGIAESSIAGGALNIGKSLLTIGGPLGALAGSAVVTGGVLTGVGVKMAILSQDVQRTAQGIGVTTDQLQEYRGAAKLAGIATESMDSALASVGNTFQGASAGRLNEADTALKSMHIDIKRNADGVVDAAAGYRDLLAAISKIADPNLQRTLADMFGVGDTLAMIRRGPDELQKSISEAHRLGVVQSEQQIANNVKQANSWNGLKASVDGLGTSLGNLVGAYSFLDTVAKGIAATAERMNKGASGPGGMPFMGGLVSPDELKDHGFLGKLLSGGGSGSPATHSNVVSGKVTGGGGTAAFLQSIESKWGLPSGLLDSVWSAESNRSDPKFMTSKAGAQGPFQFMPKTAKEYGLGNPFDFESSADAAGHKYSDLLKKYNGDVHLAAAAYNWGDGNLDSKGMANAPAETRKYADSISNGVQGSGAQEIAQALAQAIKDHPFHLRIEGLPAGASIKSVRGLGPVNTGQAMAPGGAS